MPPSGRHDRQEDYDTEADVGAGRLNANIDIYLFMENYKTERHDLAADFFSCR